MASKSFTEIDIFVAISDVPAFPGATKSCLHFLLCAIL